MLTACVRIRAIELYATLTYLAKAGMYRPDELEALQKGDDAAEPWVAREAVRLRVLLVCLERLIDDLDTGAIAPSAYGGAVRELAQRLGQARVAWP